MFGGLDEEPVDSMKAEVSNMLLARGWPLVMVTKYCYVRVYLL